MAQKISIAVVGLAAVAVIILLVGCGDTARTTPEKLVYHQIKTDAQGKIIPWYSANPGRSYDHVIKLVWNFWHEMRRDYQGLPYYMNHQIWRQGANDYRGIGGDQLQMALSSWALLYMYCGDGQIIENMKFIADYYLTHSLSSPTCKWPNIPYPYNTYTYSGIYDGDMILGRGYTQPDKAGSFGAELITLYKITGNDNYLDAAAKIADTLAMHTKPGDADNSPLPFKVNTETGNIGILKKYGTGELEGRSTYTTNWTGSLRLFSELIKINKGNVAEYRKAFDIFVAWMQEYPLKTNKWGPFFEDVPGWSDTQINAVTYAMYIMENRDLFPNWQKDVRGILDWPYKELGNKKWEKYGVVVVNEQTAYRQPGNSHSSRQASMELLYAKLTGDTTWKENAIRQLSWATYMVDFDGKSRYPIGDVWMTDGYGDYVRHYLRAMAACPELAPDDANHILSSASVVTSVRYHSGDRRGPSRPDRESAGFIGRPVVTYKTYDADSTEVLRMTAKPTAVYANKKQIAESNEGEGWTWQPLTKGGVLQINHSSGQEVVITK